MWLKISEDMYLPMDGVVGFFGPGVLGGDTDRSGVAGAKEGRGGRACALMRDGRVVALPFGLKAVAGRSMKALGDYKTNIDGE